MRGSCIFSGSSHPQLVESICERLGQRPALVDRLKFSNGETSVTIKTSVRDQDVFIVQSGSGQINDNVMEMLIMISACKGGSARSITAVMPYFPYSRQSKQKAHRSAITARMLANLMKVAGVDHVITIDLHASQMQGFFKCPVDNLLAEPILARWIKLNIPGWQESVVVSKNPGGTKRVTSLADALNLSFGIVTTDRRRPKYTPSRHGSGIFESIGTNGTVDDGQLEAERDLQQALNPSESPKGRSSSRHHPLTNGDSWHRKSYQNGGVSNGIPSSRYPPLTNGDSSHRKSHQRGGGFTGTPPVRSRVVNGGGSERYSSPLARSSQPGSSTSDDDDESPPPRRHRSDTTSSTRLADDDGFEESEGDETDEQPQDIITGRLVHGHIVDDDVPSPSLSAQAMTNGVSRSSSDEDLGEDILEAVTSITSTRMNPLPQGLGGSGDATVSDEEEEAALQNPEVETTVTLVGNVRDKPVLIIDDMIDKAGSWIAAAETVVKRGGATSVYCMATHGLFGGDCLRELDECDEIEAIVVTNAFPISPEKMKGIRKLVVLDVSNLLAEAIRRNHHGESISKLYQLID